MTDTRVDNCDVEVDKPHALRFADSVSITVHKQRT
jgi:dihydroneopterin aldolase